MLERRRVSTGIEFLNKSHALPVNMDISKPHWVNLVIVRSPRWIFISSPIGFFDASLVEKLLPCLTPENLWKFYILPGELGSLQRGI